MKTEEFESEANYLRVFAGSVMRSSRWSLEDREDMVAEAICKAWTARHRFDGRSSLRTWMCSILVRVVIDASNKVKRRKEIADITSEMYLPVMVGASGFQSLESLAIDLALDGLPEELRFAVSMRRNGYTFDEIAADTDATAGALKQRVSKAKNQIKAAILDPVA